MWDWDGKYIKDFEGNKYTINLGKQEQSEQYFESRITSPMGKKMSVLSLKRTSSLKSWTNKGRLEVNKDGEKNMFGTLVKAQNSFNYSNRVDLVFAFASPLTIQIDYNYKESELGILDHAGEYKVIDNTLKNLLSNLNYK